MGKTNISWTDYSWNPWNWVCTKVSEGCKNCYAHALATRYGKDFAGEPVWRENAYKELSKIPSGNTVFVADMSDIFLERVPVDWVKATFNAMMCRPDLTFLLLTKRIERARDLAEEIVYPDDHWPRNVWLGTSVENQKRAYRIEVLWSIEQVEHRFLSLEPLLGPIEADFRDIDGVITGGESGPNRRPFDKQWVRDIARQCERDGVMLYHKQGSAFKPGQDREIDGRTYDALPWRKGAQHA